MTFEEWWKTKNDVPCYGEECHKAIAKNAYQAGEKEWEDAVIDQLVILHIYQAKHDANPRLAVKDVIDYHVQIALDPQVSSDAAALIQRGRDAMPTCLWNNVGECWETTCGHSFEINDGAPAENDMKYCCYCGGKVEEDIK